MNMNQLKEWNKQEIEGFNRETQDKRELDYHQSVEKLITAYEGSLYEARQILAVHADNGRVKEEVYTLREVLSFFAGALASIKAQRDGAVSRANSLKKEVERLRQTDMFLVKTE